MSMNRNKRVVKQMAMKGENKKCFECDLKSTPYVIMDFGIFVCTKCSGIHRNFQHKVKGISMTNFKDQDVKRLKEFGGNEEARKKWRAKHDPKKYPLPKPNDEYGIRKFVDQTFVAKRWYDPYFKKKATSHTPPKSKPKSEPKKKPTPKRTTPISKSGSGRKKKPFRTQPTHKKQPNKVKKTKKDPFGEGDPFDQKDPFGDDGDDWFEDFPDDNDFSKKKKTPIPKENPNPQQQQHNPDILLGGIQESTTTTTTTTTTNQKKEGFTPNEDWSFNIEEEKKTKKFPDLDKLFGAQPSPPKPNVGRGGFIPTQTNPYPYTPPNTQNPNTQYRQNPYQPVYNAGRGRGQQPVYGGGRGQQPVSYHTPPTQYQQPQQHQNPYQPNPYSPPQNPSNPFLVAQQHNPSNPFLVGNTPPQHRQQQHRVMGTGQNMGRGTGQNILGGPVVNNNIPTNTTTNQNNGGLGGFFGSSTTAPSNNTSKLPPKKLGPDPFQDLLGMGSFQ